MFANVELVPAGDTLGQNWKLVNLNNGYYRIIPANSSRTFAIDVQDIKTDNGTNIQIYYQNYSYGQQWEIVALGNNLYTLKPRNASGRSVLDIAGGATSAGTNIQLWDSNGTGAQKFYLEKVSPPTSEYIESKAEYIENGRFLGNLTDARGNKTTYTYNSSSTTGTGTLKDVTDAKSNKTSYTYDNLDRITSASMTTGDKTYTNSYTYANDRISTITHNGFNLSFIYDNFGNTSNVRVGTQDLVTNTYAPGNGNLTTSTYGNTQKISYTYDRFDRVSVKTATDGTYEYTYDAKSNMGVKKDNVNAVTTNYTYDLADRLVKVASTDGFKYQYAYDSNSNVSSKKYSLNTIANDVMYSLDPDNKQTTVKWANNYLMYGYDSLSRQKESTIKNATGTYKTSYDYLNDSTNPLKTTTLLQGITNGTNAKISYTYDANGNVETITEGTNLIQKYYYDGLNQLVREDNKTLNKTIVYNYDLGGNITSKDTYAYTNVASLTGLTKTTVAYTYDATWKDKLSTYNGKAITYDQIGNPLTYDGNTYTWKNGRQLSTINKTGSAVSYKYNDSGIRTQKTVNGVVTNYYLEGDQVIYEKTGTNTLYYNYDAQGNLVGFKYNDAQYYYLRNGQQDIVGILDSTLKQVVSYTYDTWGKVVSIKDAAGTDVTSNLSHIGNINPYKYRGYRLDNESGMYYLNSRYYNPDWGRFINADNLGGEIGTLLTHNLFAYCNNNPVNMYDPDGHFFQLVLVPVTELFVLATVLVLTPVLQPLANSAIQLVKSLVQNFSNPPSPPVSTSTSISGNSTPANPEPPKNNDGGKKTTQASKTSKKVDTKINIKDGMKVKTNDALDLAEDYLGDLYIDKGNGRFLSKDGVRQIRMGDKDILGKHMGAPHINFDTLYPKYDTVHIFIEP